MMSGVSGVVVARGSSQRAVRPNLTDSDPVSVGAVPPKHVKSFLADCRGQGAEINFNLNLDALASAIEAGRAQVLIARDKTGTPCGLLITGQMSTAALVMGHWERHDAPSSVSEELWSEANRWIRAGGFPRAIHFSSNIETSAGNFIARAGFEPAAASHLLVGAPTKDLAAPTSGATITQIKYENMAKLPLAEALGLSPLERTLLLKSLHQKRGLLLIAEDQGKVVGALVAGSLFGLGCISHLKVNDDAPAGVATDLINQARYWFGCREDRQVCLLAPDELRTSVTISTGFEPRSDEWILERRN